MSSGVLLSLQSVSKNSTLVIIQLSGEQDAGGLTKKSVLQSASSASVMVMVKLPSIILNGPKLTNSL